MPIRRSVCALSGAALAIFQLTSALPAIADKGHAHGPPIGQPAEVISADRTVEVVLHDNYFEPERIEVAAGETLRFVIRNEGAFVHEFNIGTREMHAAHQAEMMMMVEHGVLLPDYIDEEAAMAMQQSMGHGMHDEPNSVLLEPGASAEIIWTFPHDGPLEFACNVPGHYAAGMQGNFEIVR